MPIMILGCKGSMGRRYSRILTRLGVKNVRKFDIEYEQTLDTQGVDRVIIATPTQTHYRFVKFFGDKGLPMLCEKPMVTSSLEAEALRKGLQNVDFRVVCNWAYVFNQKLLPASNKVYYANETSGKDGLVWDCIQLLYLCSDFDITMKTGVPWDIKINGKEVTPEMIEDSYFRMIADWLKHPEHLWGIDDAVNQICKAETYIKERPCSSV
jgi:hypothetical protein